MRSEFLGQAAALPGFIRLIRRPWVLRPPGANDLRAIVAQPAEVCGYTFEAGLLDRILSDPLLAPEAVGAAAPLPLLQFALERLWLKTVERGATQLLQADYDAIGGLAGAVTQHAESVYQALAVRADLGPDPQRLAERVLTALVSTHMTRQPRRRDQFQEECGNPESARRMVDYLVGERLLTIRSDPDNLAAVLVDLAHEVLIGHWERLRAWLSEDPQGRQFREALRADAERWEQAARRRRGAGRAHSRVGAVGHDRQRAAVAGPGGRAQGPGGRRRAGSRTGD
jgi:hypothetical protein